MLTLGEGSHIPILPLLLHLYYFKAHGGHFLVHACYTIALLFLEQSIYCYCCLSLRKLLPLRLKATTAKGSGFCNILQRVRHLELLCPPPPGLPLLKRNPEICKNPPKSRGMQRILPKLSHIFRSEMPPWAKSPPPNHLTWATDISLIMIHMKATINVEKAESSALNSFRTAVNSQCHTTPCGLYTNRFFRTKHLSHFLRKIPLPPTHISS